MFYEFDGKEVLSKTSPRWHFPYPWQIGWEPWHRYHGPIETRRHRPGESEPRAPCGWSYNDMLRAWEYDPAWKIKQRAGVLVPGVRLPRQERSDENVQR